MIYGKNNINYMIVIIENSPRLWKMPLNEDDIEEGERYSRCIIIYYNYNIIVLYFI